MSDSMPTLAELEMAFDGLCSDYTRAEIMERAYLALKAQRDELLIAIKALRGDKPCGHNYCCICPDELAKAAIANAERDNPCPE